MVPLVSILIPSYNSETWIKSTIECALAQTWKNKEIIIVDDGSTDNTYSIAKQYESKYFKVITQVNSGACVARNRALSLSQGEFIQWLDADDLLASDKIENQLSGSDLNSESEVIHSCAWGYFYHRISKTKYYSNNLWQNLSPVKWLQISLGEGSFIPSHAWLVSRRLTELAGPWDERLKRNQDGEYFCRVVASSEYVKFHANAKCYYRKGNLFSISMSRSKEIVESLNLSNNLCIDHLLNLENNEVSRKACANFLKRVNNKIHPTNVEIILENQKRIVDLGGEIVFPTKTKKFTIFKYIFGIKTALMLKEQLWNLEIIFRKKWDKLLAYLFEEKIKN